MLVAIIAIMMVFGIPLSAIIGSYYVKLRRMDLEAGGGGAAVARRVAQLEADNRDLRARIETLETIVTSDDASHARVRVDAGAKSREAVEVGVGADEAKRTRSQD